MTREQIEQLLDLFTIAKLNGLTYVDETAIEFIEPDHQELLFDRLILVKQFTLDNRKMINVVGFSVRFKNKTSGKTTDEVIELILEELAYA